MLDPFSGRGTTLFEALLMGRNAIASDINPVAYCITGAKAETPSLQCTREAIDGLEDGFRSYSRQHWREAREQLPEFFGRAFQWRTLDELLYLRTTLDWRGDRLHRFIAALVLGSLHGDRDKSPYYFSNQMPRTISPKPAYALRWWRRNHMWPRRRRVFDILRQRAAFRLAGGVPATGGRARLCDVRRLGEAFADVSCTAKAVVTSPPYFDVTNYEEDQWLRLWFLGHAPRPTYGELSNDDRHTSKTAYWQFISDAWRGIAPLVREDAVLVCRMGGKGMTGEEISARFLSSARTVFPSASFLAPPSETELRGKQTRSFRPPSTGCRHEWDYVVGPLH